MIRTERNYGLAAAHGVALFLLAMMPALAQQPMPPAVQQAVPDNPLHPEGPVQPLPYSHKTHLALGLTCTYCHTNPEPGKLMTYPATSTCMSCHHSVAKEKPSIRKLAAFAKSGQAVPWVRVYAVLPGVNWTHRAHVQAGVQCETCHGQAAQMEIMSETTSVDTMYACLACHQRNNAKTTCNTCHPWPQN